MKQYIIILFCALTMHSVHAQNIVKETYQTSQETLSSQPAIIKGYYSIHNNARKMQACTTLVAIPAGKSAADKFSPAKGYYATWQNHNLLYRSGKSFIAVSPRRPFASKGYHSIEAIQQPVETRQEPDTSQAAASVRNTSSASGK